MKAYKVKITDREIICSCGKEGVFQQHLEGNFKVHLQKRQLNEKLTFWFNNDTNSQYCEDCWKKHCDLVNDNLNNGNQEVKQ